MCKWRLLLLHCILLANKIWRTTKPAVRAVCQGKANDGTDPEAMITSLIRRCPSDMSEESCVCATSGPSDACRSYIRLLCVRELACEIERDRHPSATAASIKAASVLSQTNVHQLSNVYFRMFRSREADRGDRGALDKFIRKAQAGGAACIYTDVYVYRYIDGEYI